MGKHRIVHLITGLATGGAEMMLYKLLAATDRQAFNSVVISLMTIGTIGPRIVHLGIPVHALGMRMGIPMPGPWFNLRRLLQHYQPDLIQGWMYHANIAATCIAATLTRRPPVLWNIRQSLYDITAERLTTRLIIRQGAKLSHTPHRIIYNSEIGALQHESIGYAVEHRQIIYNGFDTEKFKPCADARSELRRSLAISPDTLLIGLIGRYHAMKDHATFIEAAIRLVAMHPEVQFVLVGTGITWSNPNISMLIRQAKIEDAFHLLGERNDIPTIMAGIDIITSSSWSEGFPNVVGEAMACGTPCVVTDVGESTRLVAETGFVVPRRNPNALVEAWQRLISAGESERARLGLMARRRIVEHFSINQITSQYQGLYTAILDGDSTLV